MYSQPLAPWKLRVMAVTSRLAAGIGTLLAVLVLMGAGAWASSSFTPVWPLLAGVLAIPLVIGMRLFNAIAIICIGAFLFGVFLPQIIAG